MFRTFARTAALTALTLAVPATAAFQIVNVDATGSAGTVVNLAAGTYTVSLAGIAGGGIYDAWSPWGNSSGCDAQGANCSQGYGNSFAIDFGFGNGTFNGVDGYQFGYVATPGTTPYYETAALSLSAYQTLPYSSAPLPFAASGNGAYTPLSGAYSFTLASAQQVRFFAFDYPYNDNRGGFSLKLDDGISAPGGVPEPASWALMLGGFGLLGAAMRRRRETEVFA
jgi:hypothetical protein